MFKYVVFDESFQKEEIKIKCPYCFHTSTKVTDKRETENLNLTRRRRECLKCGKRFTTYERVETIDLTIIKKDGRREQFDREKLRNGIFKSCEKRPISLEKIEKLIESIEVALRKRDSIEVESDVIGEMVMKKLKKLDNVAYIRFASVYRNFQDVNDFKKELRGL